MGKAFIRLFLIALFYNIASRGEPLSMELKLNNESFKLGEEMQLEYVIKNEAKYSQYILINDFSLILMIHDSLSTNRVLSSSRNSGCIFQDAPKVSDFKLLMPNESYTYASSNQIINVSQATNGVYWLKYYGDAYQVPAEGFLLSAKFFGVGEGYNPGSSLDSSIKVYPGPTVTSDYVLIACSNNLFHVQTEGPETK